MFFFFRKFYYELKNKKGNCEKNWQSELRDINFQFRVIKSELREKKSKLQDINSQLGVIKSSSAGGGGGGGGGGGIFSQNCKFISQNSDFTQF